jgi:hypothetical protein
MAQNEFVDLYAILQLAPETDTATVKKRINEKYLEAQQNLDHRNPTKRLEYQQLYEIYLPQARHLLLDGNHRAEYDRYLQAFRSGKSVSEIAPIKRGAAPAAQIPSIADPMDGEGADPQQLAAKRESLWEQWKSGLESSPSPGASTDAPIASSTAPSAASSAAAPAPTAQRRPKRQWGGNPNKEEEEEKRRQESAARQRQRDHEKKALAQANAARKIYGISGGLIFLLLLPLYLFMLRDMISAPVMNFLPNGGALLLQFIAPTVIVVLAFFFSQWAGEFAYQRTLAKNNVKAPSPGESMSL